MKTVTLNEFHKLLKSQGLSREGYAFKCPGCGIVQNARDLIAAGAGENFEEVEKYLGFSCVGRWTGAGSPRKEPDGEPCNWTLGGFLKMHEFEVVDGDERHPMFEPATPKEAQWLILHQVITMWMPGQ